MVSKGNMILKSGLYIVATPIGNLEDITLRALKVLKECDTIICEDSRVSRKLLNAYGIEKPMLVYHDHNAEHVRPRIIQKLESQEKIAFITDAGMPLISDPGYKLVRSCREHNLYVTIIPGASAVLAGLVLSAMPSDRFTFCGFADFSQFEQLQLINNTLIFFESSPRLVKTLEAMSKIFLNRSVSVVREITKMFEETKTGSFQEVIQYYNNHPPKGEIVIVLCPPTILETSDEKIDELLKKALSEMSLKDASEMVAMTLGLPKKKVYQRALELKNRN